jgi:soluble lytic murein transglycosylase-like protein
MRSIIAPLFAGAVLLLCSATAQAATVRPLATTTVQAYATVLHTINPQLPQWQSRDLARRVLNNASHWKLDPNLLIALVSVESRWQTHARSSVGAIGLGQLMPGTAAGLHVDPSNAGQNLSGAARYLSGLIARFKLKTNRFELACAAYNAGPDAVTRFGGIPPYAETQSYVVRVMSAWQHIAKTVHVTPTKRAVATDAALAYWTGR